MQVLLCSLRRVVSEQWSLKAGGLLIRVVCYSQKCSYNQKVCYISLMLNIENFGEQD